MPRLTKREILALADEGPQRRADARVGSVAIEILPKDVVVGRSAT